MVKEPNGRDWSEVLSVFPFPAAVLDGDYRFLFFNAPGATDPILVGSGTGETDPGGWTDEATTLEQALNRRRYYYEQCLRTQVPLVFEETIPKADGRQPLLWFCIPVRVSEDARLIVARISTSHARAGDVEHESSLQVLHSIKKELYAPLTAMVGLAGTLAQELSGAQQARASLIEQSGRLLLKQLRRLMQKARTVQSTRLQR